VIDVQQVRELVELMVEHDLSEIRIKEGETAISLRKGGAGQVEIGSQPMPTLAHPVPAGPAPVPAEAPPAAEPAASPDDGLVPIASPMVGTFFAAPDPDSEPFVRVGMELTPDSPVCIIEAMKVFNEIKAEIAGRVERIMVSDQDAVEYGQPLIMVRPTG
jgi:acetyl-CoA carboxylase biotin carboxyl carrier protein